jgi:hypothetical protein
MLTDFAFRTRLGAFVLLAAASAGLTSHAQTTAPRTRRTPANVVSGAFGGSDAAAATIRLKLKSGTESSYRYTDKTLMLRAKKPAEIDAFQAGEAATVRFRQSSVGPASLYDLVDTPSWLWLDRLRHETTLVTVDTIEEETLRVKEGPDRADFAYRITEKTQWSKAGKPATPSDYKKGDAVYVAPRLLPGGSTMAIAVSDAPAETAKLKERSRSTLAATIKTVNVAERKITVLTVASDEREFRLTPDCIIRRSGKDVPITYLKPRQAVTLHLTRDEGGETVVRRITIKPKQAAVKPSMKPEKVPGRKP